MKNWLCLFMMLVSLGGLQAQTFTRELPGKKMREFLAGKNFPNEDAVIVLNEQSYVVEPVTRYIYGFTTTVPMTSESNVQIVKVYDNAGAAEYADHDFYFAAYSVSGEKATFYARARVLKPNGDVEVMPKDDVKKIAFLKAWDGTPLVYKVIVKIPNVAAGDIIQYESYHETDAYGALLTKTFGGLFFYNNRAITLFSNLYITVPVSYGAQFYSFPEKEIGKPKIVKQTNPNGLTEVTYFWSVTNLRGIPDEPYSLPFEESSFMTAVAGASSKEEVTWNKLAAHFEDKYLSDTGNPADELKKLGMPDRKPGSVDTLATIDTLYTKLRKYFLLSDVDDLYPDKGEIGDDFKNKKADASDQALIMYGILKHWGVSTHPVWIRDERDGDCETSVPVLDWFDRLGVLATVNGKNMLYDFDRGIPAQYETPWFLQNANVMVLGTDTCYQWTVVNSDPYPPNMSYEKHTMTFGKGDTLHDSIILDFKGRQAQHLRGKFYRSDSATVADYFKSRIEKNLLSNVSYIGVNDFLDRAYFAVGSTGISSANVQKINSLLVVTPGDLVLSEFRNKLYSSNRQNPVDFGVPFSFNVEFMISIPPGYTYVDTVKNESLIGPSGAFAVTQTHMMGRSVDDVTSVAFPQPYVKLEDYKALISFIDSALTLEKRSVVFKKK